MNRRDFLKTVGLSAVGVATAIYPSLPPSNPKPIPATFDNKQPNIDVFLADTDGNRVELPTLLKPCTDYQIVVQPKR